MPNSGNLPPGKPPNFPPDGLPLDRLPSQAFKAPPFARLLEREPEPAPDLDLDVFVANGGTVGGTPGNQLLINQGGDQGGAAGDLDLGPDQPEGTTGFSSDVALGDLDGDGDIPAVDENGLPNLGPDFFYG